MTAASSPDRDGLRKAARTLRWSEQEISALIEQYQQDQADSSKKSMTSANFWATLSGAMHARGITRYLRN